jgi:dipeptidyl aminopeptidase/acylaminoacyl peptidase
MAEVLRMKIVLAAVLLCGLLPTQVRADVRRLEPDDVFNLKDVSDPRISPDGAFVAYTVTSLDRKEDEADADLYLVPVAGGEPLRLTTSPKSETTARFSPDGRLIAFLSDRDGKKTQVWLMGRHGGEAFRLTSYASEVSDIAWSPDSKRLALVVRDPDPEDDEAEGDDDSGRKAKTPKPIVIRRRQFMRDGEGYLREFRKHIHVFDVAARSTVQVTEGPYDDGEPAWTPDGQSLVFSSNRTADPDSNQNTDIFVVAATAGAKPRALSTGPEADAGATVSPDGKWVAYVADGDPADLWYGTNSIVLVPLSGTTPPKALTRSLDRNAFGPRFSHDSKWVYFIVEANGNRHICRVSVLGGPIETVVGGERTVGAFDLGPKDEIVFQESRPDLPGEISLATAREPRRLTFTNDEFLKGIRLSPVERFQAKSPDGTVVDGFLTRPPDSPKGKLPTILRIHGGPTLQYDSSFEIQWQVLAAQGFAVVAANPRGSAGYGRAFARAIWADWGNHDFDDVMAALDHVIAMGVADPDRLGVGGWSYGGILTDNVITKTDRFKAAISGAGDSNYLAGYGTDEYQYEWEVELGLPWKNADLWVHLSPFTRIDRAKTPTLVLCGSSDMNVPLLNSEQLYQALKRLGVETELVIYPGAAHDIERPSFQKDRLERYIAWYSAHLKPAASPAP